MTRNILLLTLALTLGAADSVTLLCRAFCDHAAATEGADVCEHNQPADRLVLASDVDCASVGLPAVREEMRGVTAAPDAATAISVSHEPPEAAFGRAFAIASSPLNAGSPPRTVALRI